MTAPKLTNYADGVGTVQGDQFNTFCQTCDNLAQLADFVGAPGLQVYVRGTTDVGDGGQGNWFWDATAIGPTDNATVVIPPAAGSGGWARLDYLPFMAMFLPSTADVPDATPNGGFLFVDATGILKYRGPTSITVLAPA